jgi:Domain of unknown function (DUF4190)
MTNPEPPSGGVEFPSLENSQPPMDPYAPVDYPSDYPGPGYDNAPPAGYPPPQYQSGYPPPPGYPAGFAPGHPQAPGYPSYGPYYPGRPPGTNGKAIAALVAAIGGPFFCFLPSIAGLILGIIAMRETRRTGQDGYGLALAGLIISSLAVVAAVLGFLFFVVIAASSSNYETY